MHLASQHHSCLVTSFDEISISPRLGNTPRVLRFANNQVFETNDNELIDQALQRFNRGFGHRLIHTLESHWLMVLLSAIIVTAVVWGGAKYGVPWFAHLAAKELPVESNQYLAQGALKILDETYFEPSHLEPQRQQALRSLFSTYSEQYPQQQFAYEFRQTKDATPNAFALPDGTLVFTDTMVELAAEDNELVAILAHEMGHVVHQHTLRRVIQDSLLTVLMVLITGDIASASSIIIVMPSMLLELAYSREFETEADDFAYEFLIAHDLSPQLFANIMTRLDQYKPADEKENSQEESDKNITETLASFLSTHPITRSRIEKFSVDASVETP